MSEVDPIRIDEVITSETPEEPAADTETRLPIVDERLLESLPIDLGENEDVDGDGAEGMNSADIEALLKDDEETDGVPPLPSAAEDLAQEEVTEDEESIYLPSVDDFPPATVTSADVSPAPALIASVQTHSQAIMASVAAFQEAERKEKEAAILAEREDADRRLGALQSELDAALDAARTAQDETDAIRSDADEVLAQLSQALDQVRKHAALVANYRQEIDSLNVTASAALKEAEGAKDQLSAERHKYEAMEERVLQAERRIADEESAALAMRSEIESLRRILSGSGVRPITSLVANDDMGAYGTAIFPVQVTAVIDCKPGRNGAAESGVGVVFDVRMVAAIPPNPDQFRNGIENAVALARSLFPTASLSIIVGEDCDITAFRSRYGDVTFVSAPLDDSRRKAARVLANAAGHLRREGTEPS